MLNYHYDSAGSERWLGSTGRLKPNILGGGGLQTTGLNCVNDKVKVMADGEKIRL